MHLSVPVKTRGLQGGILSLREDGQLACSYLGTNPTAYTPPAVVSRDINYVETDKELMELYKVINAAHKTGNVRVPPPPSVSW